MEVFSFFKRRTIVAAYNVFSFPSLKFLISLTWMPSHIIEGRVCYLTMCDRAYPKKLAFQYLEDLKNEFERVYGNQIETAARPYAFIKFGKLYLRFLLSS